MGLIGTIRRILRWLSSTSQEAPDPQRTNIDHEYDFEHYTEAVETVKELKREGSHDEALDLLEWCIRQTEAESHSTGQGVAPWYYKQVAIIYRKDNRHEDEVEVLERYKQQKHAPGVIPEQLLARLERARALADK